MNPMVNAETTPALEAQPRTVPDRLRAALGSQMVILVLVLLGLLLFFSLARPDAFPTIGNLRNIATNGAILLILAVGGTFVILTGGIDLSINGVLVFSGVISAMTMVAVGGDNPVTLTAGLVTGVIAGAAWGLLNGVLIAKGHIPPLIVTLGTMGMSLGAALLLTDGIDISDVPRSLVVGVGSGRAAGVPWLVLIAAVVAALGMLVLRFTRFGRYNYAAGSNPEAARRAGIAVPRHLIKVYALAGSLAGLAGYLSVARFATTTLSGHTTENLQVIAAVVIGGTSLFGGVGGIGGTIIGVAIPIVLLNGFVVLGLQPFWQMVAVGAVLITAVYIDQLRRQYRNQ